MDPNGILLITITVFVAFMTIGVWGILFALVRSRSGANEERNTVIRGITEECAEADRALSSSAVTAMSPHSLKSALSPKIEKIRKMLAMNMHILDVYFVKYTESRLAVFQAALGSSESGAPVFPIDKFLSETKPAAVAAENRSSGLSLESPRDTSCGLSSGLPLDTVLVKRKGKEEPIEPPAIDLRTGIITVTQEEAGPGKSGEAGQSPAQPMEKPASAPARKKPVLAPKKQPPQSPPGAEEAFDFEKEISERVGNAIQADIGQGALDTKVLHTEKTLKWDRDELKGLAAGKPESIVVEGAEQVKADKPKDKPRDKSAGPDTARQSAVKGDEAMISGEDIENTLDSFFGLGDK